MKHTIAFVKMHGLGNDFVIVEQDDLASIPDIKKFVIKASNRRIGVGCDQFITYKKFPDFFLMTIFNQDGSEGKACGNASRCLTRLIHDKYGLKDVILKVGEKEVNGHYVDEENSIIDMGEVSFNKPWMPKPENLWQLASAYVPEPKEFICVDVGNPHLVIFSDLNDKDKKLIGKALQKHRLFPEGVNVNFATVHDNEITLQVWERGVGFTMACGSGAIATFAASNKFGFVGDQANVCFELGKLSMTKKGDQILMQGSSDYVFEGKYYYEE